MKFVNIDESAKLNGSKYEWHFQRPTFAFLKHQNIFIFKEVIAFCDLSQILGRQKCKVKWQQNKLHFKKKMLTLMAANIYGFTVHVFHVWS